MLSLEHNSSSPLFLVYRIAKTSLFRNWNYLGRCPTYDDPYPLTLLTAAQRAHTADPRLRAHNSVEAAGLELSTSCSVRVTLASHPKGIGADFPDCGGAGCEELPTVAFQSKDATVSDDFICLHTNITSLWRVSLCFL